jgi:hypothetical protein
MFFYYFIFYTVETKLSPSDLRVVKISATSGQVHWLPAHSSYQHEIFVNETLLECIKPGCSAYTINELTPGTHYQVQVRILIPDHLMLTVGKIAEENLSAEVEFTTSDGGRIYYRIFHSVLLFVRFEPL